MEQKIYELLLYCYENSLSELLVGVDYQLFTAAVKSLLPFEDKIGCKLEIDRYKLEINSLKHYKNGNDKCLEDYLKEQRPSTHFDENMLRKILPIVIANTQWDTMIDEVLRCIVFYTFNRKNIFDAIVDASLINEYLEDKGSDLEYLNQVTRERLIDFSIKDFFLENYNITVKSNYLINFEKERILLLMKSNIFDEEYKKNSVVGGFILDNDKSNGVVYAENEIYLNNFTTYLLKLRKGIMDPDKLKTNIKEVLPLNAYLDMVNFQHPLLGRCSVVKRTETGVIIKTKIGYLKVKK